MRQSDVHERVVKPLIGGMNLVDVKVYADKDGVVEAVLLKYVDPHYGAESNSDSPEQAPKW